METENPLKCNEIFIHCLRMRFPFCTILISSVVAQQIACLFFALPVELLLFKLVVIPPVPHAIADEAHFVKYLFLNQFCFHFFLLL